jgi:hypothetical protein
MLIVHDSWYLNQNKPYFISDVPQMNLTAGTTQVFTFPALGDDDEVPTWHTCDLCSLTPFAKYNNLTRKLTLAPAETFNNTYECQCILHDVQTPSYSISVAYTVTVMPVPLPPPPKVIKVINYTAYIPAGKEEEKPINET